MADKYKIDWFESSAKMGINVNESFRYLAEEVSKRYEIEVESLRNIQIEKDMKKKSKKTKCCK